MPEIFYLYLLPCLGMAERVGFEPTVPLPRRMLSKHVDSSTLAPLRNHTTAKGGILSRRFLSGKIRRTSPKIDEPCSTRWRLPGTGLLLSPLDNPRRGPDH
ncbi:MAG: hypothetical protein K0S45_1009 [Nitrospira sp.]|nr:hypothetical protein [Nitrospira sp.]